MNHRNGNDIGKFPSVRICAIFNASVSKDMSLPNRSVKDCTNLMQMAMTPLLHGEEPFPSVTKWVCSQDRKTCLVEYMKV